MTIAVQIKNEDTSGRCVTVKTRDHRKDTGQSEVTDRTRLKPGEARTFHIHLLRDLEVEEENPI